jgi:glycosyltransferase involved in cell wall biosynthesis
VLSLVDLVKDQGGAERFAVALATHLPPDRFESWMCSTRFSEPATIAQLQRQGVGHLAINRRGKFDLLSFWRLVRLLRRERFDVLHAHKFGSNLWGTIIGRACGVPVVLAQEHTWSYEGNPLRAWLDGHVIGRLATRFVAVSTADAKRMVSIEGVPPAKIVVIPAAVNVTRSSPGPRANFRDELGIGPQTPLIAVAAVPRPQKALWVMVEALALVRRRGLDAHLAIAGEGPDLESLKQLAQALGVAKSAHFLGRRTDVESIIEAANVGALSSDYEGTPVFVAECVAAELPLVSTAVGGIQDLLEDGRTAILVPPRDPQALADGLARLIEDPSEGRRLAAAARVQLADLTIEVIAERFGALYEALVDQRQVAGGTEPAGR